MVATHLGVLGMLGVLQRLRVEHRLTAHHGLHVQNCESRPRICHYERRTCASKVQAKLWPWLKVDSKALVDCGTFKRAGNSSLKFPR
jgi:hypothetical protein